MVSQVQGWVVCVGVVEILCKSLLEEVATLCRIPLEEEVCKHDLFLIHTTEGQLQTDDFICDNTNR